MDYAVLSREEWRAIAEGLEALNGMLRRILSAPRCKHCGSVARNGLRCGVCGNEIVRKEG